MRHLWKQNPVLRNIGILVSGTVFAQGLVALILPILTRLYTPEHFSVLAVYAALIGIISTISCLRFNIAIPLPESDEEGAALCSLAVASVCTLSLLLAIAVCVAPSVIVNGLSQPALRPYLWMLPVGVFLAGLYTALQYWSSRKKRFALITRTRITRAVAGSTIQLGGGVITLQSFGLLLGHMVYSGFGVWGLARDTWRQDKACFTNLTRAHLARAARRYRRFPLISTPEALFDAVNQHVPIILIAAYADETAGLLLLAMRIIGMPVALLGGSISQVYLSEAPAKYRAGELGAFTLKGVRLLLKTGGPVLISLALLAPFAFPVIFGSEWAQSGAMVVWLVPMFTLQFAASPVSMILQVTHNQPLAFCLQAFGAIITISAIVATQAFFPERVVEIYAVVSAFFYAIYLTMIVFVAFRSERPRTCVE